MKLSQRIKPVSYLEAHAPELLRDIAEHQEPVIITEDGEAKAVLQDIASYEETQETLALLKVLVLTGKRVEEGDVKPAEQVFAELRADIKRGIL